MNYQFQFDAVFAAWPLLLKGTWITVQLSLVATVLGLVVAIFCAWGKTSGPGWLRFVINAYIEVIRNTPFLVQLFFFFSRCRPSACAGRRRRPRWWRWW